MNIEELREMETKAFMEQYLADQKRAEELKAEEKSFTERQQPMPEDRKAEMLTVEARLDAETKILADAGQSIYAAAMVTSFEQDGHDHSNDSVVTLLPKDQFSDIMTAVTGGQAQEYDALTARLNIEKTKSNAVKFGYIMLSDPSKEKEFIKIDEARELLKPNFVNAALDAAGIQEGSAERREFDSHLRTALRFEQGRELIQDVPVTVEQIQAAEIPVQELIATADAIQKSSQGFTNPEEEISLRKKIVDMSSMLHNAETYQHSLPQDRNIPETATIIPEGTLMKLTEPQINEAAAWEIFNPEQNDPKGDILANNNLDEKDVSAIEQNAKQQVEEAKTYVEVDSEGRFTTNKENASVAANEKSMSTKGFVDNGDQLVARQTESQKIDSIPEFLEVMQKSEPELFKEAEPILADFIKASGIMTDSEMEALEIATDGRAPTGKDGVIEDRRTVKNIAKYIKKNCSEEIYDKFTAYCESHGIPKEEIDRPTVNKDKGNGIGL